MFKTASFRGYEGLFLTHSRRIILLYLTPVNFPTFLYYISTIYFLLFFIYFPSSIFSIFVPTIASCSVYLSFSFCLSGFLSSCFSSSLSLSHSSSLFFNPKIFFLFLSKVYFSCLMKEILFLFFLVLTLLLICFRSPYLFL